MRLSAEDARRLCFVQENAWIHESVSAMGTNRVNSGFHE
jgi:hypothetical protein